MDITPTDLSGVVILTPVRHGDERGFFSEVWKRDTFEAAGLPCDWVQDNHSRSGPKGVLRGLHYQTPPFAQDKLLRVVRGAILDVAVDLRRSSPTFGKHVAVELSAENWRQLLVPAGFAHGFLTLSENTEVLYKVSAPYAPDHERGLLWNDPALGIPWGVTEDEVTLSSKDRVNPTLEELTDLF
ncbi:MAG TPA: dTDP-4-dehydrorhamnose 3,5-epimerase [Planctomycetes bacterium]|nr:dTDP-4-dehydrorhamnose 3,5-epimerase [Planctomycetota bacterium]